MPKQDRELIPPTPNEARVGAGIALANSKRHQEAASTLAANALFGSAIAHLVLAAEEAVKASLLAGMGLGGTIKPTGTYEILRTHSVRHWIGAISPLMMFVAAKMVQLTEALIEDFKTMDAASFAASRSRRYDELAAELTRMEAARPGQDPVIDEMDWWKRANKLKLRGLYADWSRKRWWDPGRVTKKEFEASLRIVSLFLGRMNEMISLLALADEGQRGDFVQHLAEVRAQADAIRRKKGVHP